jgi:hypothetical protein
MLRPSTGVGAGRFATNYLSSGALAAQGVSVRNRYANANFFTPSWYQSTPGAWYPSNWAGSGVWAPAAWGSVAGFCGYTSDPMYYDYGNSLVYQDDQVYYNGDPIASVADYAAQALALSGAGRDARVPADEEWQSLGVFGIAMEDGQVGNDVFQLAVDKGGVIRGTYFNAAANTNQPIYGSVDPKSQRAAWTVGDAKDQVFETGIYNLTQDETPMLVHTGKDQTQQWTLVRLPQPTTSQ